jgi:hypothetical protein
MWRPFHARLVPIFVRLSFICELLNAFERVSKVARNTSSKARVSKFYAPVTANLVVAVLLAASSPSVTAQTISLGAAQNFAVLGGSTVTNSGPTSITGNIGVSPGTAIGGFPPGGHSRDSSCQ